MNQYFIYALGFFAQSLFGARSIVQWYLSEREGKVVSPTLFWVFSLLGSSLFLLYGLIRQDIVILIGQSISFYVYVRNLQLKRVWSRIPLALQLLLLFIPPSILVCWFQQKAVFTLQVDTAIPVMVIGIAGQLLLNCRYLYQWHFSEKAKESVLPLGFWVISLAASVMVVVYSIARQEPVLLVAQSLGLVVYLRNIIIYSRNTPEGQSRINNTDQ
ncbi:MAG: lipid-A-disaccharide synthase N-terminal domain-containing protein [Cyclobacteriaceae bacterium]|nr:lipid-A-disaccharide synthase N-terminal domain-containing protein [Cyclobacteriaceae bacterium]